MDLDGDGANDVLTGTGTGALLLFRGKSPGDFSAGESLIDKTGKLFNFGDEVGVNAADWDSDGDLDLIVGTRFGKLMLVENEGSKESFAFTPAQPLIADGFPLVLLSLDAPVPFMADWDADEDLDLLVGTSRGLVLWYENIGNRYLPQLAEAQTLVEPRSIPIDEQARALGATWGTYARVCATDFNGDGRLDLLVGDHHANNDKDESLSSDQKASLENELTIVRTQWAAQFGELRKLPADSDAAAGLRGDMVALKKRIATLEKQLGLSGPHGYVWLLIRR